MTELTQELLIELLHYDQATGIFTWKRRDVKHFKTPRSHKMWNSRFAEKQTGCVSDKNGRNYLVICVLNTNYLAHRLAWIIATGKPPIYEIDHVNGDGCANWFANLRDVPHLENTRNSRLCSNNSSGINGAWWDKNRGKYLAYINIEGKRIHLGRHFDIEDAKNARADADIKYRFHKNHGSPR